MEGSLSPLLTWRREPVTSRPDAVQIAQHGTLYRLVRGPDVYAVRTDGDALRGEWVPAESIPDGATVDLSEEAARVALPLLRSRAVPGRPALRAGSPDGRLIAQACKALGLTRRQLAVRLGTGEAVLSRASREGGALPSGHADRLRAWIREVKGNDVPSKTTT